MRTRISERSFEEAIECALLAGGPDACAGDDGVIRELPSPYGEPVPGGYHRRDPDEYDRNLCLIPRDVIDFVLATQPKMWATETALRRRGAGALPETAVGGDRAARYAGRAAWRRQGLGV